MIKPILACVNPYETSKLFVKAGWHLDFSQPIESGDPLVGVSLNDNVILLGVTNGYVNDSDINYIGCGVVLYLTVPKDKIEEVYEKHKFLNPTDLQIQPWGNYAFEICIDGYKFMIASS